MDPESVYCVVRQIPRGRVTTYGHIAYLVDLPNNARQVGQVLKHLPEAGERFDSTNVPWWRVINSQGSVSARIGKQRQIERLAEELAIDEGGRVDLSECGWFPEEVSFEY